MCVKKRRLNPIIKGAVAPVDFDLLLQQPLLYLLILNLYISSLKMFYTIILDILNCKFCKGKICHLGNSSTPARHSDY